MNLHPPHPIQYRLNQRSQRKPSSRGDQGGAPERSKPRPSNLMRFQSRRSQPSITVRRLRHIFKPTLKQPKSRKASLRSASRVGIAIKHTSSSWHRSRVWFTGEGLLTRTIYGSPSPAQWDARSAMNSPFHCAGPITGTIIVLATSRRGGAIWLSIPSGRHGSSGSRRDASNRSHQKSTRKRRKVRIEPRIYLKCIMNKGRYPGRSRKRLHRSSPNVGRFCQENRRKTISRCSIC
jgi:hypothetical protein